MNEKIAIEEFDSVNFERREVIPENLKIANLSSITLEQMIDLKAKVINLQKAVTVKNEHWQSTYEERRPVDKPNRLCQNYFLGGTY